MHCQHDISTERLRQRPASSGFTLVEMLVATGLVVLIMSLFAQIYSSAIGMLTQQRAMGNNDQKARVLSEILRNDLKYMTYRQTAPEYGTAVGIVPLALGDEEIYDADNQKGYFYYSENDPLNPTDDVLQFTVEVDPQHIEEFFVGKAVDLGIGTNQPCNDGGPDNAPGQSRFAEVSYFLRNGTLYRRVLLLRDPLSASDEQPGNGPSDRLFVPNAADYGSGFWNDFDYSVTRRFNKSGADSLGKESDLWFHGKSSLANVDDTPDSLSLGFPWNRFGFLNDHRNPANPHHGNPREYFDLTGTKFLGRFTHEETSSANMPFPGNESDAGFYNVFNRNVLLNDNDGNYAIDVFENGNRFGEDIVLTNVESFDVEIWDSNIGGFVSLNNDGTTEDSFHYNRIPAYGPHPSDPTQNNVFDTWHPAAAIQGNTTPPRRPLRSTGAVYSNWNSVPAAGVSEGDTLLVPSLQSITPPIENRSIVYRAIREGVKGTVWPEFPLTLGNIVQEPDQDPDGVPGSGDESEGVWWQCVDNRIGLRAMRITIRYVDQKSRLPKQMTILHSFAK